MGLLKSYRYGLSRRRSVLDFSYSGDARLRLVSGSSGVRGRKRISSQRSPRGSLLVRDATQEAYALSIHHYPAANVTKSTIGFLVCWGACSVGGSSFR